MTHKIGFVLLVAVAICLISYEPTKSQQKADSVRSTRGDVFGNDGQKVRSETSGSNRAALTNSQVQSLSKRYAILESESVELGSRLREATAKKKPNDPDVKALEAQLRAVVQSAFEARQRLQQTSVVRLEERLKKVQQQIDTRQRLAKKIIDRRIQDLSDPHVRWSAIDATDLTTESTRNNSLRNIRLSPEATNWPIPHSFLNESKAKTGSNPGTNNILRQTENSGLNERANNLGSASSINKQVQKQTATFTRNSVDEPEKTNPQAFQSGAFNLAETPDMNATPTRAELRRRLSELEKMLDDQDLPAAPKKPRFVDPSESVVHMEIIIEQTDKDGRVQASAAYVGGTVVSRDGLIVVGMGGGESEDVLKNCKISATATFSGNRPIAAKFVRFDAKFGIVLFQADIQTEHFLPLISGPVPVGRQLKLVVMQGQRQNAVQMSVAVEKTDHVVGETKGLVIVGSRDPQVRVSDEMGGALVSHSGELNGIVSLLSAPRLGDASGESGELSHSHSHNQRFVAIPSSAILKLLETHKSKQKETEKRGL